MASESSESNELRSSLLTEAPAASEGRPTSRWSYPQWGVLFASLFIAYHTAILLIWNLPSGGLNKTWHKATLDALKGRPYFSGTRNTQSWKMFAPNPNRDNSFVRVLVEDHNGETWDFEQDIWGVDRYPYLWYDRRGKINRNLNNKPVNQKVYGAWVCREWERLHDGEPAKSVTFIRRWTMVPKAKEIIKKGGWKPFEVPYKEKVQETITCKTIEGGQLTNELRARYGLPPVDEKLIRRAKPRTWAELAEVERRKAERDAKRFGGVSDVPPLVEVHSGEVEDAF